MTQLPNEPADAFAAFNDYCRMGEGRTLRGLHQSATKVTPIDTLKRWSAKYNWQERVKEFDANTQDAINKRWLADRAADKKTRITYLTAFRGKIGEAMSALDPTRASMAEVSSALKMVVSELRAEYDDEPVQRNELSGTVSRPSIPPELISDDARREGALLVVQQTIRGEGDAE